MIEGAICEIRLGLPGSGKSLDQTYAAVLPHLLNDEEVYCCYWLNWNKPNFHYFHPGDFDAIKHERNCVVVFDELAQTFEPRDWEGESGEVRAWFQLHRHNHVDIYANTQDVSLVAKTVGIIADQWIRCSKIEYGWLWALIRKWLGFNNKITILKEYLTFQQLKKMANGWEIGEDVALDIDKEKIKRSIPDILCHDLDDYKIELVHKYCPKCAARQGSQILKEDTEKICEWIDKQGWQLKIKEFCPKHKDTELEIRESGLYDTDYIPQKIVKFKTFKAIKLCPDCGKDMLGYKAPTYTLEDLKRL